MRIAVNNDRIVGLPFYRPVVLLAYASEDMYDQMKLSERDWVYPNRSDLTSQIADVFFLMDLFFVSNCRDYFSLN